MGIQLDETDLSELEPQIFKIFKNQLGFFDNNILSNTMEAIHQGIDRGGLESRLASLVESKKAQRLTDEVRIFCISVLILTFMSFPRFGGLCLSST